MCADHDTGLGLDKHFDFQIDATGDIDTFVDVNELHKDLSGQITVLLDRQMTGQLLTPNQVAQIERNVANLVIDDVRVTNVRSVRVAREIGGDVSDVDVEIDSIYGRTSFSV